MKTFFRQIWAGGWMLFWAGLFAYGSWWLARQGWWLMGQRWTLTGLAVCGISLVPFTAALHGVWLALLILAGRLNPRMARRKFRNGLADMVMYAKTGLWKE